MTPDCPPVGATDSPDEPIQRFGLTLTKADFDKLGDSLERINKAERRAISGPDFVGAVAEIRALAAAVKREQGDFHCQECGLYPGFVDAVLAALDRAGCP